MLHQEAKGYFECLSGSDGMCFHYGTTCEPKDGCMYESSSQLHKVCDEVIQGRCEKFSAKTCEPQDSCMYDTQGRTYRRCTNKSAGACRKFAEHCLPKPQ
jgi:hypothetical protein